MRAVTVDHYGVHRSPNDLLFLIQEDEQNARGLNVKSNIRVRTHRRLPVTHALRLEDGALSATDSGIVNYLEGSRLGRLFLPTPNHQGEMVYIEEDKVAFNNVVTSTLLSNPMPRPPVIPAWRTTPGEIAGQSRRTNIQPYIITAITPRWMRENGSRLVDLFRVGTRPLILLGSSDVVVPTEIIRTSGTAFSKLRKLEAPPQQVGGIYLKNWMRK